MGCLRRTVDIAGGLEARPLLAAAKGVRARLLADTGLKAEARDELAEAIAIFERSKMTVYLERAKAAFSRLSDI
jgi:hypothetical protein